MRKAVAYSPDSTDPHLHLGEALAESGRLTEGLVELKKAADLAGPDDARPGEALKKSARDADEAAVNRTDENERGRPVAARVDDGRRRVYPRRTSPDG